MLERVWRKGNPLTLLVGIYIGTTTMENSIEVLQKTETKTTCNSTIPLLGIYPEKTIIQKDACTPVFSASLFIIAKTWKQPKYTSKEEWIKKMWHIHTMEYYSAIKNNEILPFASTQIDLEIIILSEKVRQRNANIKQYHLYVEYKK